MQSDLSKLICKAIQTRHRIRFEYNSKTRIAEPQCCGVSTAGKEVVRAYLLHGGSRPEQLFELSKITHLVTLDDTFTKPGPNYREDDSAMREIYCQL